ncbi:MAG: ROK family protein [Burkholderiaceae bacterium]|nr:MAG: ROK family protein [Burkholderiaceae bacterium]
MYRLGIDLGGTKIECAILEPNGRVLVRERVPTEAEKGLAHILGNIKKIIDKVKTCVSSAFSIGIGTPGSISMKTGLLRNSNTQCLNGQPLKELLQDELKQDVHVENDANCFALAEATYGAGRDCRVVIGVILGTGCGAGIVVDRKIYTGANKIAGEFGHHTVSFDDGRLCWCGRRGCVETYVSGSGIEAQYFKKTGNRDSAKNILNSSCEEACNLKREFYEVLGVSLGNVCNILDPEVIVIGGGLSNHEPLYKIVRKHIEKHTFSDAFITAFVKNRLGDSAGVIGAAILPTCS